MALYHKEVGFPLHFKYPKLKVWLDWGRHAQNAAQNDRYGIIKEILKINTEDYEPIEVEMNGTTIIKMVIRSKRDIEDNHLVLVVMPKQYNWFVKTVWYNKNDDNHDTLDRSKYVEPAFKRQETLL